MRLQLELFKPEMALATLNVRSTIVLFGGTQIVERPQAEAAAQNARKKKLAADPQNASLQRSRSAGRAAAGQRRTITMPRGGSRKSSRSITNATIAAIT